MESIVVSGGAGGIGGAIAKKFVDNGLKVYIVDINPPPLNYENCIYLKFDLLNPSDLKQFKIKLEDEKIKINHFVSSHGRALEDEWNAFSDQKSETIHNSIELNLVSHIRLTHLIIPFLDTTDKASSITLISSINAQSGFGLPVYRAAKAGMYGFVRSVAAELGKSNIRVNSISPGTVITPATLKESKDFYSLLNRTALDRFTTVVAAALIAERKVNTLVLVHRNQLIDQWKMALTSFLSNRRSTSRSNWWWKEQAYRTHQYRYHPKRST